MNNFVIRFPVDTMPVQACTKTLHAKIMHVQKLVAQDMLVRAFRMFL